MYGVVRVRGGECTRWGVYEVGSYEVRVYEAGSVLRWGVYEVNNPRIDLLAPSTVYHSSLRSLSLTEHARVYALSVFQ